MFVLLVDWTDKFIEFNVYHIKNVNLTIKLEEAMLFANKNRKI